jgi:hypothetical protein
LGVEKLAIETDSPILQSILPAEPPPLFRVLGVMDWEKIFVNPVERKNRIISTKRPNGIKHIIKVKSYNFFKCEVNIQK